MRTGGRTSTNSTVLDLDETEELLGLDVPEAVRAGARAVRLVRPVHLTADAPQTTLAAVRLLREAQAEGIPVIWHGSVGVGIDQSLLVHLPPPERPPGAPSPAGTDEWRKRYRPGLCYYRLGPAFVFVKDVRIAGAFARFSLDGVVDEFRTLEGVVDVAGLDSSTRALLDDLDDEHLMLRLGDLATLLPSRMRRWPVPALEV